MMNELGEMSRKQFVKTAPDVAKKFDEWEKKEKVYYTWEFYQGDEGEVTSIKFWAAYTTGKNQ